MPGILDDSSHWDERAEQSRALAEMMSDPQTRRMMLDVAEGHEKLAERARQRLAPEEAKAVKLSTAEEPLVGDAS